MLNELHNIAANLGYTVRIQNSPINIENLTQDGMSLSVDEDIDEIIFGGILYPPDSIIMLYNDDDFIDTFLHELGHAICHELYGWFYHSLSLPIKESLADDYGDLISQILNSTQHK